MNESELIAIIGQEEAQSISSATGKLAEQRRAAMQYYYGEPYGNEVEGRSQLVTTEVKDAIEGIMPSLMAIFTTTDEIVRFDPQNENDVGVAQQATDYINYTFNRANNGFVALYCLIKDALLQKNGYVKVYWEEYESNRKDTYEGLTPDQLAMMMQSGDIEIVSHEPQPDGSINASFRSKKKKGRICIDPVPPEEVLVSRECPNDLNKARFVEHRTLKTISEVREMGFDVADDIPDFAPNAEFNMEKFQRNSFDDSWAYSPDKGNSDPTTRKVWLCEAYMNVDFDGDGIAEYRKITKIGMKVLDNVEFDSLPLLGGTAILMPHKHYGLSIYDLIGDIQVQKSMLTRNLFDNIYFINNGRYEILDQMVNMDDLLTNRPGGGVRVKAMGSIKRMDTPVLGQPAYQLLEYMDKVTQNRVGSTGFPNAVDPDAVNAKAAFHDNFKEASMERINLMARILGETVIKDIMWKIMELVSKHQNKPQMARLRDKWVQVDPREWQDRFDMTVTVGLGTGSQQTTLNGAMGIMQIQDGLAKMGLLGRVVTERNAFAAANRYAKSVFPKEAEAFFTDPTGMPPPQQQPNPDLLKIQLAAQKASMGNKQKYDKMMMDWQNAEKNRALLLQQMGVDLTIHKDTLAHDVGLQAMQVHHDATIHSQNQYETHYQAERDRMHEATLEKARLANQPEKPVA